MTSKLLTRDSLVNRIFAYIQEHEGMSASASVVGRALKKEYTWRDFPIYSNAVRRLKNKGRINEIKGRYYVNK